MQASVCAVTVTYGNRQHLVLQVLLALLKEPAIQKVVVVSNGAQWDVQAMATELGSDRINVVDLERNRGSAPGFAAGIKLACELGTDFIWLLDDDNEPQEGALSELLFAHESLRNDFPNDNLAVVAFRAARRRDAATNVPLWRLMARPSSFWGFHLLDVPYKFWRRTPWGEPKARQTMPSMVQLAVASYGGLLFHRAVVEAHGLPREDFVVYADDGEFTWRISQSGGAIRLIPAARVSDLEASWHMEKAFGTTFYSWLMGESDVRVFYGARNHTYLDSHCFPHHRLMYWLNRRVYCLVLWGLALGSRRVKRYRLLRRAIRDGLKGRLGVCPEFPL